MNDVRLALRMIAGKPGMSALAIVALALGIGLTTVMFSIVNGVLLRGLPFDESERIYYLSRQNMTGSGRDDDEAATLHDYVDWRARQRSFAALAAFRRTTVNVVGHDGSPTRYSGCWMTANTFQLLGVRPVLGRDLREEDNRPGAEPVVVIGDTVWQERFDRDPDAVGQSLRVNGIQATVVGVMPPTFRFPELQDLWLALTVDAPPATRAASTRLSVIGRLPHETPLDQAGAELATIARQLEREYPDTNTSIGVSIVPYNHQVIPDEPRRVLTAMMVSVVGVLIIACVNVANLVLARAAARTREIAVRTALGASRGRVVRQMLIEVLMLAVAGATIGLGLSWFGVVFFSRAIVESGAPYWIDVRIDGTVLLFVTAITVLATVASGLVPAVRASRTDLAAVMNDEGRATSMRLGRLSRGLVVVEMAVSFGLLVVSALIIQSIVNMMRLDYGFDTTHIWSGRATLGRVEYATAERERQFGDAVLAQLRAVPGVQAAALTESLPPNGPRYPIRFRGQSFASEHEYPQARGMTVSAGFFALLRVGVEGRVFDDRDRADAPAVAIVSRPFARRFFPDGALGREFALVRGEHQEWRTIVGVAPDLSAGEDVVPETFFLPFAQVPLNTFTIVMRTTGPPLGITGAAREAVRTVDPNLPVWDVRSFEQRIEQSSWALRIFGSLFTAFGVAALFLATVGLYGVMAFSVSRRTQEVGVRMAMGAHRRDVLLMVLRQGLTQVALGIVIGAGVGVGLGSLMQVLLFGVSPFDARVFMVVAIALTVTALAACLVPARRAAGLDPMVALRRQ